MGEFYFSLIILVTLYLNLSLLKCNYRFRYQVILINHVIMSDL